MANYIEKDKQINIRMDMLKKDLQTYQTQTDGRLETKIHNLEK